MKSSQSRLTLQVSTTARTKTLPVVTVIKSTRGRRRITTLGKQILSKSSSVLLLVSIIICVTFVFCCCCFCFCSAIDVSNDVTEHDYYRKRENIIQNSRKQRSLATKTKTTKLTTTTTTSHANKTKNPLLAGATTTKTTTKTTTTKVSTPSRPTTITKIVPKPKSPSIKAPVVLVPVVPPQPLLTNNALEPNDLPIRINCGYNNNNKWIDPKTKLVWKNDYGYSTTTSTESSIGIIEKNCNPPKDTMSCSYQQGFIINYTIPVLVSKERYKITFVFNEPTYTSVGARLFDIYVEGIVVKSKVDIISLRYGSKNINKLVTVSILFNDVITDGAINILLKSIPTLKNGLQQALVNGIIIELLSYRKLIDFPLRINCGSTVGWIDPKTKLEWLPDTDYNETINKKQQLTTIGNECYKQPNPLLPYDQLYCNYRLGFIINYSIRVLNYSALYNITLYFQEPSFFGQYKRPMDIFINNKSIKESFDIVNYSGNKNQPTSLSAIVTTNQTTNTNIISIKLKTASGKYYTGQKVLLSGLLIERL